MRKSGIGQPAPSTLPGPPQYTPTRIPCNHRLTSSSQSPGLCTNVPVWRAPGAPLTADIPPGTVPPGSTNQSITVHSSAYGVCDPGSSAFFPLPTTWADSIFTMLCCCLPLALPLHLSTPSRLETPTTRVTSRLLRGVLV
ncbi:hypothetical protein J4Q44_G00022060 [Coregonus suidteri]|uniref:Uncharacterized protein n=1 Tax=Coregonus suidteri TaxID=861788 RepID=A0AAN8MGY5_9TELE